jgi:hypothetical protein
LAVTGGVIAAGAAIDWAPGDHFALDLPAHPEALHAGGPAFLTRAFHASGVLSADNAVTAITRFEEWAVGGTGPKVLLSVAYAREEAGLAHDLFVKFSRSFTDATRDGARYHMEPEVRLALLSRDPVFPVAVPRCCYADFHHASGTGVVITERVPYGQGAVEPHHHKCMDHLLPSPIAHYRVLIATLGRLSGTHRAGALGPAVERDFPFDLERAIVAGRNRWNHRQLTDRADRMAAFFTAYPHLLPPHLADPAFLEGFRQDAPKIAGLEDGIRRAQLARPEMIALCHWNANIDNAWFWRDAGGALQCGLIDWGSVGQMHVCQSIWGCLGAAEPEMIDRHLEELLALFADEYARAGGPALDPAELDRALERHVMMSGLGSLMSSPRAVLLEVPDPALVSGRHDPAFDTRETARVQLKVTVNFLAMWHARDLGRYLRG